MPLLWLSLAFLLGLLAASAWQAPWWAWAALGSAAIVAAIFETRLLQRFPRYAAWRKLARLPVALLLVGFALGALRIALAQSPPSQRDLAWYNQRGAARIVGVVNRPPQKRDKSLTLQIEVESLAPLEDNLPSNAPLSVRGELLARLPPGGDWRYGDRVALVGSPTAAEEESSASYASYLQRQGISAVLSYPAVTLLKRNAGSPLLAFLYDLRSRALEVVRQLWPQPESALMAGILLGDDSALPQKVTEAFQQTGTAHIIAISGFNISILAGLFVRGFGRFTRRGVAVLLALLSIGFYTLLVGAQPSVVRAAVMGAVGLFGPLLGRRQVGANSLAFVAALMCLFNPSLPWDISFQLSFSGTLGLVLFADPLLAWLTHLLARRVSFPLARRIAAPIAEYFLFTLAAQAATLPIIAYHFQRVSLSAVMANPLVLPIQPLVMVLGGLALLGGLAWLPLGQLLAGIIWPLPALTIRAAEALAQLPNGSLVTGQVGLALVILYYALLFAFAVGLLRPARFRGWLAPGAALLLAALLALGAWRSALAAPTGKLQLTLLGLQGGPALLVRAPQGQTALLNGAADSRALEDALARRLPPFGARLDALLITTRYASPLNALASLVERFPPAQVAFAPSISQGAARNRLVSLLRAQKVEMAELQTGSQLTLGQDARLTVLAQTPQGTALVLEWKNFRALLPGGVAPQDLARLPAESIQSPGLLLLTPADLEAQPPAAWEALNPALVAWLQPGALINRPGWLSLEQAGWLELATDGEHLWVEAGQY